MTEDELRTLRGRIEDLDRRIGRAEAAADADLEEHYLVAKLKSDGAFPTAGNRFYAATPQLVAGPQAENGTPTLTALTATCYPLVLGTGAPAVNDPVLASRADHRWVCTPRTTAATNTTVNGTVYGCTNALTVAGITVVMSAHTGGAELGRAVTNASGAYSISYAMGPTTQFVDFTTLPEPVAVPRFTGGPLKLLGGGGTTLTNRQIFRNVNTIPDGQVSAAPGFTCWLLAYPLKNTLNAWDPLYNLNTPMTNPGGGATWTTPNVYPNLSTSDGKLHMDFTLAVPSTSAIGYPSAVFIRFNVGGTPNHPPNPSYVDVTEI